MDVGDESENMHKYKFLPLGLWWKWLGMTEENEATILIVGGWSSNLNVYEQDVGIVLYCWPRTYSFNRGHRQNKVLTNSKQ